MMDMMTPAALMVLAESFAGQPVMVDERLRLPVCESPALGWAAGLPARVEVRCDVPAWRVFLPVRAGQAGQAGLVRMVDGEKPASPLAAMRRGDKVVVAVRGMGFVVSLDAVADGAAREGRLWVRVPEAEAGREKRRTRVRRLLVRMGDDGVLEIDGLNARVNGR